MQQEYPILEYDPNPLSIIDIDLVEDAMPGMSEQCVICFFRDVFERFSKQGIITPLTTINTTVDSITNKVADEHRSQAPQLVNSSIDAHMGE